MAERDEHRRVLINEKAIVTQRKHARGRGYGRDRNRGHMTECSQLATQAVFEHGPAAEQSQARTDFEQQRMRRAQADVTRIAIRPGREAQQQALFRGSITRTCVQLRAQRTRGRERLTRAQASAARGVIQIDEMLALLRPFDHDTRLRQRVVFEYGTQREIGKMQAGPEHGKNLLRSIICAPAVLGILLYCYVHSGSCAPASRKFSSLATVF